MGLRLAGSGDRGKFHSYFFQILWDARLALVRSGWGGRRHVEERFALYDWPAYGPTLRSTAAPRVANHYCPAPAEAVVLKPFVLQRPLR